MADVEDAVLFDVGDFAPPTPAWAEECFYCVPDEWGRYDEARHLRQHLPVTCAVCGETMPNRLLADMNHAVNLGGSWRRDAVVCASLDLRLNHLRYDAEHGVEPDPRDLTALDLGWTITDEGEAVPPAGWPDGTHAVEYVLMETGAAWIVGSPWTR